MDLNIGNFSSHYRMSGGSGEPFVLQSELDGIVQQELCQALHEALASFDDPAVYVIREMHTALTLPWHPDQTDKELAGCWADQMAKAILSQIHSGQLDDGQCVKFEDHAEYVAHFMIDLIEGHAINRWYYSQFNALHGNSVSETLERTLFENQQCLIGIFKYLNGRNKLEALFNVLNSNTLNHLWEHSQLDTTAKASSLRALFDTACRLFEALEWFSSVSCDFDAWFESFSTITPPAIVDWRSPQSLSRAVIHVLDFLDTQGNIQPSSIEKFSFELDLGQALMKLDWLDREWLSQSLRNWVDQRFEKASADLLVHHSSFADGGHPILFDRIVHVLCTMLLESTPPASSGKLWQNYLKVHLRKTAVNKLGSPPSFIKDVAHFLIGNLNVTEDILQNALAKTDQPLGGLSADEYQALWEALTSLTNKLDVEELPPRQKISKPTPKQHELLKDLSHVLESHLVTLGAKHPSSAKNRFRWYVSLINYAPHWADDDMAKRVIEHILNAWQELQKHATSNSKLKTLRNLEAFLQQSDQEALKPIDSLGASGIALLNTLNTYKAPLSDASSQSHVIDTQYAGVFLLLRAILDARLPFLANQVLDPSTNACMLWAALGLFWSGVNVSKDGLLDEAITCFAGLPESISYQQFLQYLSNDSAEKHTRFQIEFIHTLINQRAVQPTAFNAYRVQLVQRKALVIADHSGVWLFGQILSSSDHEKSLLDQWSGQWHQVTGEPLSLACSDIKNQHHAISGDFLNAFTLIENENLETAQLNFSIAMTANLLLRAWARWLRQFAESSSQYLLENFIRTPGKIFVLSDEIRIELQPISLGIVLEMSGYLSDLEPVPWLGNRTVRFQTGSTR